MFTWINKQGVQSDAGFIVQRTGRFTCEYREGGHSIELEVESSLVGDRSCISISKDAFASWTGPLLNGETKNEQQARLLKNFKDATEFKGMKLMLH